MPSTKSTKIGLILLISLVTSVVDAKVISKLVTKPIGAPCSTLFDYAGKVYFCARHPLYGEELHTHNGLGQFSTETVVDLIPGVQGSSPFGFFELNGSLFFFANTPSAGYALWRTDGTSQGTQLVRSISQDFGVYPTRINAIITGRETVVGEVNGHVYFEGYNSPSDTAVTSTPAKLFVSNGTSAGTQEVIGANLVAGTSDSVRTNYQVHNNSLLYLSNGSLNAVSGSTNTPIATLPFTPGFRTTQFTKISFLGNRVINADGGIWLTNGSTAGTILFRQAVAPEAPYHYLTAIAALNSGLVYIANQAPESFPTLRITSAPNDTVLLTEESGFGPVSPTQTVFNNRILVRDKLNTYSSGGLATGGTSTAVSNLYSAYETGSGFLGYSGTPSVQNSPSSLVTFDPITLSTQLIKSELRKSKILGDNGSTTVFSNVKVNGVGEIWATNGNIGNAILLKGGFGSLDLTPLRDSGARSYFLNHLNTLPTGEMWTSNGTSTGTYPLKFQYTHSYNPGTISAIASLLLGD